MRLEGLQSQNSAVLGAWPIPLTIKIDNQDGPGRKFRPVFQPYAIKAAIERYKKTPNSVLKYLPPLPKYGCFVRSALITKFPDIIVEIGPSAPAPTDPPILLGHQIIDPGTMLCLFSSIPSKDTWNILTFTQPPHQQTFIVADHITGPTAQTVKTKQGTTIIPADTIVMEYRRAYTIPDPSKVDAQHSIPLTGTYSWSTDETGASPMYVWTQKDPKTGVPCDVRTLLMDNLAPSYLAQLQAQMDKSLFDDSTATSALMAWQQSDPSYSLTIDLSSSTLDFKPEIRSILPTRPSETQKPVTEKTCSTPPQFTTPVKHITPVNRNSGEYSHPVLTVPPHRNTLRAMPLCRKKIRAGFPTKPIFRYTFSPTSNPSVFPSAGTITMGGVAQDILFTIMLTDNAGSWPVITEYYTNQRTFPATGTPVMQLVPQT